jgi:hypothetical protein
VYAVLDYLGWQLAKPINEQLIHEKFQKKKVDFLSQMLQRSKLEMNKVELCMNQLGMYKDYLEKYPVFHIVFHWTFMAYSFWSSQIQLP